ncbi:MAG: PQQ-binding-like beta-propeller repeat protein, partial [Planctomycetes bacterium]|nr:PQQ-binding-like beta-propeller repeat protein [Planctomycetota bacterium]
AHSKFIPNAHGSGSFGAISPQGYIAVDANNIYVSNGRARAIRFDKKNGRLLEYETGWKNGSWPVCLGKNFYLNGGMLFNSSNGIMSMGLNMKMNPLHPIIDGDIIFAAGGNIARFDASTPNLRESITTKLRFDYEHKQLKGRILGGPALGSEKNIERVWLAAKNGLIASRGEELLCIDKTTGAKIWSLKITSGIGSAICANGKIFVVAKDSTLYALGSGSGNNGKIITRKTQKLKNNKLADAILAASKQDDGYCMVLGLKDGALVEGLLAQSNLRVIAVGADAQVCETLRKRLDDCNIYGKQAMVIHSDPSNFYLAEYLCNLIVSEKVSAIKDPSRLWIGLRPYGGSICLPSSAKKSLAAINDSQAQHSSSAGFAICTRTGALPGSDDWSHESANAGNTNATEDDLIFTPLGVMWYGGDADGRFYTDRHSGAPRPLVVEGRVLITMPEYVIAYDAYSGRVLWKHAFPGFSSLANTAQENKGHKFTPATTNNTGGRMVAVSGAVYVHNEKEIHVLDPDTGKNVKTFHLKNKMSIGHISCLDDALIVTGEMLGSTSSYYQEQDFAQLMDSDHKNLINSLSSIKGIQLPERNSKDKTDLAYTVRVLNQLITEFHKYSSIEKVATSDKSNFKAGKEAGRNVGYTLQNNLLDDEVKAARIRQCNKQTYGYYFKEIPQYAKNDAWNASSSAQIIILNRKTGKEMWSRKAKLGYRHSAICAGNQKIFCIDLVPPAIAMKLQQLGKEPKAAGKLLALDLTSGKEIWSKESKHTALSYSAIHDILIASFAKSTVGKKIKDKGSAMIGKDGTQKYTLPGISTNVVMAGNYLNTN